MFKSGYIASFFRKLKPVREAVSPEPLDATYTVSGADPSSVYHVSLLEADDFVDIDYRKLSYAEAAALGKLKPQSSRIASAKPAHSRVPHNQYNVLNKSHDKDHEDEFTESVYLEHFKNNNYFLKNKVFKEADKTKNAKSKKKRAMKKLQQ